MSVTNPKLHNQWVPHLADVSVWSHLKCLEVWQRVSLNNRMQTSDGCRK